MSRININTQLFYSISLFLILLMSSCSKTSFEGEIIFTQVKGDLTESSLKNINCNNYFSKSSIAAINPVKGNESLKILTKDFYSACAPKISFDGALMIFSAQKNKGDKWQIWQLDLSNLKFQQLVFSEQNCIDPNYLPTGQIVFSKYVLSNAENGGYALFTCNFDGSELHQITFNPHSYFSSIVLKDGRLLAISKQYFPEDKKGVLMISRPDGSKQDVFYKSSNTYNLISIGCETDKGEILFIEQNTSTEEYRIVSVNYSNPLNTRVELSKTIKGSFHFVNSKNDTEFVTSFKPSSNDRYGIYEYNSIKNAIEKEIYTNSDFNIIDVVLVEKRELPRKLPSEINLNKNTALMVCQNANLTDIETIENTDNYKSNKIEFIGIDKSIGTINLEDDGSFYVKMLADVPFRVQTLNSEGDIVNGPSSWIYLRPNERRGCVGCHENKGLVPDNIQPLSVRKFPIVLPSQENKINAKKELVK
ncbi:HzsA-related protein [Lutibacter citreus]|uniref:HzsA-related protein n=1 Tax=Lutibacter citreus TaxID=2138210 RepID=UPI0013009EC5|nr:hypothetical protein [Lutibacter citreus]